MSSIVATVDSRRAQVRLDIDLSDVMAPAVTVTRTNLLTGVSTVVRSYGSTSSGAPTTLLGRLVLYDTEAALDVPLQYTAAYNSGSALVVQNLNPYFENGTKGQWAGQNNAIVTVTNSQAHQGLWSGLITPDGITAVPQAQSDEIAVTPLKSYTFGAWLRTTSNATRVAGIFWFDAGGEHRAAGRHLDAVRADRLQRAGQRPLRQDQDQRPRYPGGRQPVVDR